MELKAVSMIEAKRELIELKNKSISPVISREIEELLDAIDAYEVIISDIQELHCKEKALNIIEELKDLHDLFIEFSILSRIISTSRRHVEQMLPVLHSCDNKVNERIRVLEQYAPQCTKCSNKLIIRQGKGTYFWGCPNFPDCWGKRWLTKEEELWLYDGIREEDMCEDDTTGQEGEDNNTTSGKEIIEMLAQGFNPLTGEILPDDSFINHHNVVRALLEAVQSMNAKVIDNEDLTLDEDEKKVFESLREWRKKLSSEKNVPAFVIIENKPLIRVSKMKPNTLYELKNIKGFGDMRVSKYGEDIINIVKKFL